MTGRTRTRRQHVISQVLDVRFGVSLYDVGPFTVDRGQPDPPFLGVALESSLHDDVTHTWHRRFTHFHLCINRFHVAMSGGMVPDWRQRFVPLERIWLKGING